jgi:hypothetical protein
MECRKMHRSCKFSNNGPSVDHGQIGAGAGQKLGGSGKAERNGKEPTITPDANKADRRVNPEHMAEETNDWLSSLLLEDQQSTTIFGPYKTRVSWVVETVVWFYLKNWYRAQKERIGDSNNFEVERNLFAKVAEMIRYCEADDIDGSEAEMTISSQELDGPEAEMTISSQELDGEENADTLPGTRKKWNWPGNTHKEPMKKRKFVSMSEDDRSDEEKVLQAVFG